MRLDTVAKIEEFITNALLSSKVIPLGVNVLRLAATHDEEGIARMARSIVVRYTGSDMSVQRKTPLLITRVMSFEISIASQSYLSESGHDYAVQMCSACHMTLTNQVPVNTGAEIMVPLHLSSERFEGLTDSSHYVYTQVWQLEVQEFSGFIALDPCVARGNCRFLFANNVLSNLKPGDVMVGNEIWTPVLPPPADEEYEPEYCGVVERNNNLVYKHDTSVVFLNDYSKYTLVPTDTFTLPGETQPFRFLICNIYDENEELYDTYFASNCENRKLVQIGGNQPSAGKNWMGGVFVSSAYSAGNVENSNGPETLNPKLIQRNAYAYVDAIKAFAYVDPSDETASKIELKYGFLVTVWMNTVLFVDNEKYVYVGGTPLGKGWIKEDDLKFLSPDRYETQVDCGTDVDLEGDNLECP